MCTRPWLSRRGIINLMELILCQPCARTTGISLPASSINFTGTQYQRDQKLKHTNPTAWNSPKNGVINTSGSAYEAYTQTTIASGWVVVEAPGTFRMEWLAPSPFANLYSGTSAIGQANAFRNVLLDRPDASHGYPMQGDHLATARCANCGASSPT